MVSTRVARGKRTHGRAGTGVRAQELAALRIAHLHSAVQCQCRCRTWRRCGGVCLRLLCLTPATQHARAGVRAGLAKSASRSDIGRTRLLLRWCGGFSSHVHVTDRIFRRALEAVTCSSREAHVCVGALDRRWRCWAWASPCLVRLGLCLSLVGALLALRTLLRSTRRPDPPPSPDPPSLGRGDVSGGLSLFCLQPLSCHPTTTRS